VALFHFDVRKVAFLLLAYAASSAHAQDSSRATVSISARLPGYVRLTENEVPFIVGVHDGNSSLVDVPVEVTWNLNPKQSQGFRLVASFRGTGLLQIETGKIVPTETAEMRVGESAFRPLTSSHSIVLYAQPITSISRQGKERKMLEVEVVPTTASSLPDGKYYGLLHLEAESW
jgi:hypothetical protein